MKKYWILWLALRLAGCGDQDTPAGAGPTDRYVLYEGQHLAAGATAIRVLAGGTTSVAGMRFGDEHLLGEGGAYQ